MTSLPEGGARHHCSDCRDLCEEFGISGGEAAEVSAYHERALADPEGEAESIRVHMEETEAQRARGEWS